MILDPRTIHIAMPCHDGRVMSETCGSIVGVGGRFAALSMPAEVSNVSLVRNQIASNFLASPFQWMVCVDSDIAFSTADWGYLMQPIDQESVDVDHPEPTRVECDQISGRDAYGKPIIVRQVADLLVRAPYPFKDDTCTPIMHGMGFVRIHRSVFERLKNLTDRSGQARLWSMLHKGIELYDFFPSGPLIHHLVPTADWKGEDVGFFTLCILAGIIPRMETRTRLTHIGRKGYHYEPGAGGAQ
jgi:hypothetical protein